MFKDMELGRRRRTYLKFLTVIDKMYKRTVDLEFKLTIRQDEYQPWADNILLSDKVKAEPAPICFPHLAYL